MTSNALLLFLSKLPPSQQVNNPLHMLSCQLLLIRDGGRDKLRISHDCLVASLRLSHPPSPTYLLVCGYMLAQYFCAYNSSP